MTRDIWNGGHIHFRVKKSRIKAAIDLLDSYGVPQHICVGPWGGYFEKIPNRKRIKICVTFNKEYRNINYSYKCWTRMIPFALKEETLRNFLMLYELECP